MYLSGFFYYLSATLNPILCNLMSIKYRHAFSSLVLCKPDQNPKILVRETCQIHLHLRQFYDKEPIEWTNKDIDVETVTTNLVFKSKDIQEQCNGEPSQV